MNYGKNLREVYLIIREIEDCPIDKRIYLKERLKEIEYTVLELTPDCVIISNEIINRGYLTEKSLDDCYHISIAIKYSCDVLISWNFKHLVNVKTNRGVRAITMIGGYKNLDIIDPITLLEMEV